MFRISRMLFSLLTLGAIVLANAAGVDYSNPINTSCTGSDIVGFTCNIMVALLSLGPFVAVIALVIGGIIYIYANIFVSADLRGRYHMIATSLVVGALILAAICGGAGIIVSNGMKLLNPSS